MEHIRRVIPLLQDKFQLIAISSIVETEPYRSSGENFLNLAAAITTEHSLEDLKPILRQMESELGRIRTADKYAPRTMDLDIIVYDGQVIDDDLWLRPFTAVPVAELMPDLLQPGTGKSIVQAADELKNKSWMRVHPAPLIE